MGQAEERLRALGLTLPEPFRMPPGMPFPFAPVLVVGGLAYVSGHGPADGAKLLLQGTLGGGLSVEQGYEAGRLTALSVLASLKAALGELDRVQQWLRVAGYVRCTPDFLQTTRVMNGFSELILSVYGDPAGRHARVAPGVVSTPLGMPLVVEATVALG